jgi:PAS domain-containing protein
VHPYRTNEHRIEGAVMSFFDISSRRAAEDALRASEERFRLFVTASVDTIYKMSADWAQMTVLEGMDSLADTRGPSRTWLARYIPAPEQARVLEAIALAIRARSTFEFEHQVIRSDGSIGWTASRAVPLLDERGEVVEWFGAATDISGRKELEQARQDSEARIAAVFASLPAAIALNDSQGRIILANQAMQIYLPSGMIPSRDPVGAKRWRAWDADGRPLAIEDYPGARALRGERVVPGVEMLYRHDDGVERWVQVSTSPVLGVNGEILGHAAVIADIDALKRADADQSDQA